ncbi:MAG: hypothetical protein U0802_12290 [Candidatus Binatia bacterium]
MEQPQVVRVARERQAVDEWCLALTAVGVGARRLEPAARHLLLVDAADAQRAHAILDAYDDENRPDPHRRRWNTAAASPPMLLTIALCALFVVTGPRAGGHPWFAAGGARRQPHPRRRVVARRHRPHPARRLPARPCPTPSPCWSSARRCARWSDPASALWLLLLSGTGRTS